MKRFLLCSALFLAVAPAAFSTDAIYVNNGIVRVPTQNPLLLNIDATNFVNNGIFSVDMTLITDPFGGDRTFTTSSTQNYTNKGVINVVPGIDFQTFPVSSGVAKPAANFINQANGSGGGVINVTNVFGGINVFANNGLIINAGLALFAPVNFEDSVGLAKFRVRATNVVNSGLINMDNTGLIDISGDNLNLNRAQLQMTGTSVGIQTLESAFAFIGNTNLFGWSPATQLGPTFAVSPLFPSGFLGFDEMFLNNSTAYFQSLNPQPDPVITNLIVWRVIFLQDNSPSNVTKNVYFGNDGTLGAGAFHIEWSGGFRDPITGGTANNFFYLNDEPGNQYNTNNYFSVFNEFSFNESVTKLTGLPPATPGFTSTPFINFVTNNFAFLSAKPTAVLVDTNLVVGGNPTNLPGRIQLKAQKSMNLANAHITGGTFLALNSPVNFLGNSNSLIVSPYADLNLGTLSGSLTLSNLLVPTFAAWTGVPGAPSATFGPMGGIQAYSATYTFVDGNGFTNDVRILMVNSAIQPSAPAFQKDVLLHAPNNLQISDALHIYNKFFSDTTTLTLTTNANSAYSLAGEINLLSEDIFWSASLPNLKFLTNWGAITSGNLMNFAGNMESPTSSDPAAATPYEAFVNHGLIANQGTFIRANYFENDGMIKDGAGGGMDINAATVLATNGTLIASNGSVTIGGGSLFISNTVIQAGQTLTLTPSCSLSDGYVLSNMFGHATNVTLPTLVTNGNFFTVGGGVQVTFKPATADLLGTTITNLATNNSLDSINQWAGEDRGAIPSGFADNLALGRMIFVTGGNPSQFTFRSLPGMNNAIYIDSIEFQGGATNTAPNGDYTAFNIEPGMKVYYAQALANGASIAQKLNGKNGGGFLWVSNYAGVYSSTNLAYADGNTYIFNEALVISPNINTDGDGQVNRDDPEPIPAGLTFDISVVGPGQCAGGGGSGGDGGGTGGDGGTGSSHTPGLLAFPAHQSGGAGGVSFAQAQGSYNGLFYETNGVNPAHAGFFTAKVTSKGNFSGKLQLGGKTYSVGKAFNSSGDYSSLVTAKGSTTPLTVTLHLANNDQIVGQVSGSGWTAQLLAVIETSAAASKNSLVLSSTNDGSSTTVSGDSFGTMSINKKGDIQWSGVLPDGVKVSQKSALSKGGIWPIYSSLYGGSGALLGWLQLTNGDIGGSAVWIVPANQQNALYPNGLTNNLNATGSSMANPHALTHSTVVLSGSQLTSPLTNNVTISGKTGQNADKSLTLSVDMKNGLFTGSVIDPNSGQKLSFQGAILEKSGTGGGFFLNADKDQGGKVSLAPAN